MADNTIFIALGIPGKNLQKTNQANFTPGAYKTSLDFLPRSLSLHCKQIKKIKDELDGQPSIIKQPSPKSI